MPSYLVFPGGLPILFGRLARIPGTDNSQKTAWHSPGFGVVCLPLFSTRFGFPELSGPRNEEHVPDMRQFVRQTSLRRV
jgi:hypothetical protein